MSARHKGMQKKSETDICAVAREPFSRSKVGSSHSVFPQLVDPQLHLF